MNRVATCTLTFALTLLFSAPLAAQFGGPLAVSGDQVLVGDAGNQTLSGIVYVFGETNGAWTEVDQIRVTDVARSPDGFGRAIAADEATLVAGAPIEGATYVFGRNGDGWGAPTRVAGPADANFGAAVALTDRFMIISAPENDRIQANTVETSLDRGFKSPLHLLEFTGAGHFQEAIRIQAVKADIDTVNTGSPERFCQLLKL